MNNTIKTVLEKALVHITDYRQGCEKDGYTHLAADIADTEKEMISVLRNPLNWNEKPDSIKYPKVAIGLDDALYLVFNNSSDADMFLIDNGVPRDRISLHHFGNYENAVLISKQSR